MTELHRTELQGLIIAAHGRHYLTRSDEKIYQCVTRGKKSDVATGDRVRMRQTSADQCVIEEILPRHTLLYRSDQYKSKLLAANVTQLFIVVATEPGFSDDLVSRALVAAEAAGIRVLSFRHEQNAGYAASIAGFLTKKPGICLTVSAPGFLNGLTALANATTNCFPMILISGSSEREIVDLQQGDYEEMDQLAIAKPLCKAAFRVLHAADIGIGVARAIRAACSGRPGGVYLDLPAKLFSQVMDAEEEEKPELYVKPEDQHEVNNVRQHHLDLTEMMEKTLLEFVAEARKGLPFDPPDLEWDDLDADCAHVLARDAAGHAIGTQGGNYTGTLKNQGTDLVYGGIKVPASLQSKIATIKAGIISGKISVDPNKYPAN